MKFTFTKCMFLSSLLFTGATSWNAYSTEYFDSDGRSVDFETIQSHIKGIFDTIKSNHKNCDILMKEINGEQLTQTLETIENDLEEVIAQRKSISPALIEKQGDLVEILSGNSYKTIESAQTEYTATHPACMQDLNSSYYQYYGGALNALCQNFMNSKYRMMQTALTISNHLELKEKVQSMRENELSVHFSDGFNAKQLLERLFSYNPDDPSLLDDPLVNERKTTYLLEEISDKLFEAVTSERIAYLSGISDYQFDKEYEKHFGEYSLNQKTRSLYRDLNKILKYCLNS